MQTEIAIRKIQRRKSQSINKEEYESDSDKESKNTSNMLNQLLPSYYQYRKYLVNILKQASPNLKKFNHLILPDNYYEQKIRKCKEQAEIIKKKQSTAPHITRNLITEKIIQKRRRQLQQQKELMKKYQAQQIQNLIGNNFKTQRSKLDLKQQEHPTFEVKQSKKDFLRKRSSIQAELQRLQIIDVDDEQKQLQRYRQVDPQVKIITNYNNKYQRETGEQFEEQKDIKNYQTDSIRQSKIIQKIKSNNIKLVDADSIYAIAFDEKQKKNTKQTPYNEPKIKISYQHKDRSNEIENDVSQFQDQDFSSIHSKKQKIERIGTQQDQTNSEKGTKQYTRHNTPQFDLYSQKNRAPSKFLQNQIKKLQQQRQKAQNIQNEVSIVMEETQNKNQVFEQFHNQKQNVFLSGSWGLNQKNPFKQSIQSFLQAIKYLLYEICQLNCRSQYYKFMLKNKQYEILKILCHEEIGKGPIFIKQLNKGINGILKDKQKMYSNIIMKLIFGNQTFINFDEFGQVFRPQINQTEHNYLDNSKQKVSTIQTSNVIGKLFSVWLQINYFENKLKKQGQINSNRINEIIMRVNDVDEGENQRLSLEALERFVYSTSLNKINKLKIQLYFSKKFQNMSLYAFGLWLKTEDHNK